MRLLHCESEMRGLLQTPPPPKNPLEPSNTSSPSLKRCKAALLSPFVVVVASPSSSSSPLSLSGEKRMESEIHLIDGHELTPQSSKKPGMGVSRKKSWVVDGIEMERG
jgi:hypothetical protein